ncbi:preprotein translocase subunit YajC [Nitrospirales bacterium NOB]|nr:MAG: preprotein translocase subunit YajC [Nitrospira sp. OLB3]MBV6470784.1 Sec translocon accessory complex subunit YajC [Nitrospirota bacterium]MDL1888223.1 preprotein translocase subunit YajC [Nitrospirales bacterium NOB]QOJ36402.1 MAG: preprotein translocase subunit YajC [Nitrospira sp.]RIK58323.1 MAG: preprotein translocase subunit YajC [Nitrospira sp.]
MWESVAWAQGASGNGAPGSSLLSLVPFVLIFAIFYFMLILPQQKRQKQLKAMVEALKKGDKVITASGIWGTVTNVGKATVTLQIADTTKIKIQKEHIARLRGDEED